MLKELTPVDKILTVFPKLRETCGKIKLLSKIHQIIDNSDLTNIDFIDICCTIVTDYITQSPKHKLLKLDNGDIIDVIKYDIFVGSLLGFIRDDIYQVPIKNIVPTIITRLRHKQDNPTLLTISKRVEVFSIFDLVANYPFVCSPTFRKMWNDKIKAIKNETVAFRMCAIMYIDNNSLQHIGYIHQSTTTKFIKITQRNQMFKKFKIKLNTNNNYARNNQGTT